MGSPIAALGLSPPPLPLPFPPSFLWVSSDVRKMVITVNSLWDITSAVKLRHTSRSCVGSNQHSVWDRSSSQKINFIDPPPRLMLGLRSSAKDVRWRKIPSVTDSSNDTVVESSTTDSSTSETKTSVTNNQPPSSNLKPKVNGKEETSPQAQEPMPKRSPLTAREKLRAARVLSRYTEAKPAKPKPGLGTKVLDALRASDGGKKRSRLPEAPTNMLDDSKRGLPKAGLTFNFPGGADLFFIAFSFVFISTVMFATTYLVWKLGAIHFNEY